MSGRDYQKMMRDMETEDERRARLQAGVMNRIHIKELERLRYMPMLPGLESYDAPED